MAEDSLDIVFRNRLEELYGGFEPLVSKFGTTSYGKISSELCISASQFSKLMSGTATEGMYIRSIRNVEQLQQYKQLLKEQKRLKKELKKEQEKTKKFSLIKKRKLFFGVGILGLIGVLLTVFLLRKISNNVKLVNRKHPLAKFYNNSLKTTVDLGFLNEEEVQKYCPSSAFEGIWKLKNTYTIPLPGSKKPGVFLLAKSADVIMIASRYSKNKGRVLLGFEDLTHEIWVDKKRRPFIPTYFNPKTKTYTDDYVNLKFEDDFDFEKIAELKSFYLDEFTINADSIYRKGQPSGRYISNLDKKLAIKYNIDVNYILKEVISDLTQTRCSSTKNNYCNPNNLKEGSVISFNCVYSIKMENLGFGDGYPYTKTLELVNKNYYDNLICDCK